MATADSYGICAVFEGPGEPAGRFAGSAHIVEGVGAPSDREVLANEGVATVDTGGWM